MPLGAIRVPPPRAQLSKPSTLHIHHARRFVCLQDRHWTTYQRQCIGSFPRRPIVLIEAIVIQNSAMKPCFLKLPCAAGMPGGNPVMRLDVLE